MAVRTQLNGDPWDMREVCPPFTVGTNMHPMTFNRFPLGTEPPGCWGDIYFAGLPQNGRSVVITKEILPEKVRQDGLGGAARVGNPLILYGYFSLHKPAFFVIPLQTSATLV